MITTHRLHQISVIGYTLLVLLLATHLFFAEVNSYSLTFNLLWLIPILLPCIGIIKGQPYTYAWASFILCLYLLSSLTQIYVAVGYQWYFAVGETILLVILLVCFPFYARKQGKNLGLGLKRRSKKTL